MLPPTPSVRLVPRRVDAAARTWPVDLPERGLWRITGEAGSGITSLLVDTVLARLRAGENPSDILVIASSKESGARLHGALNDRLAGSPFVSDGPLVRSVHSLAFALLREVSEEPIRLITGAEQDAVIRELLTGHADDGRGTWPPEYRPALRFVGFARQLRDFLLRSAERGLSPEDLEEMGRRHDRPVWSATGGFLREYEQTMALSGAHSYTSYSASELVSTVLDKPIRVDRWRTIVVDDAQHLDPKSGELINRLLPHTELAAIGGDLNQSIFHFRGASPAFLTGLAPDGEINLGRTRRHPQRRAVVLDAPATQHALVADTVRRTHLLDDVDWSDIAVVVRSTGMLGAVRRALLAAGVPVHLNPTDVVLAEQRIVGSMLLGIRALSGDLPERELLELLQGPVGGADPVTLRRLLRGLRRLDPGTRAVDTLRGLIAPGAELPDFGHLLTDREKAILSRIRSVLDDGRAALADGSVEEVLWAVWQATGLSDSLLAASLRGGATGSQADRDLDAMMALFDAAGDYAERRPEAGIDSFVRHITEQELPTGVRDRRSDNPDAVALLTAHGTGGRQWHTVIVAGVQEGSWPSLGETGSLFDQEEMVDLVDRDIDPDLPVSRATDRLAEERRLFHVATTRATDQLLVTAVFAPDAEEVTEPSRFIGEFCLAHDIEPEHHAPPPEHPEADYTPLHVRVLSVPALLAELRRTVCDPHARADAKTQAARQLARLARAGVPGAHPDQWWTTTTVSTDAGLPTDGTLSPSRIEGLLTCPLREVVGKLGEEEETPVALTRGVLAHAYLEALGRGVPEGQARELTLAAYADVQNDPPWRVGQEQRDFDRLLARTSQWLSNSRSGFTQVGVEVDVSVTVTEGVRIRGRMDRLEVDGRGHHHVIDLKTGQQALSLATAEEHPQLAAYQLAMSRGALHEGVVTDPHPAEPTLPVGGGVLVYPGHKNKSIPTREQSARSPEQLDAFADLLPPLVGELAGPTLTARINEHCDTCPVRAICPVQPEGKATTGV